MGTVKTRIRSAMQKLRYMLAPLGVALVALAVVAGLAVRSQLHLAVAQRTGRALSFVTASDITLLHLAPAPGVPAQTHGSYRGRPGTPLAVVALHSFPPAPAGRSYQVWVRQHGRWIRAGAVRPDALGNSILIGEGPSFKELPEAIEVTVEPLAAGPVPLKTEIRSFAFAPDLVVAAGQEVDWTNLDAVPHTVAADDGSWASGEIARGASFARTFDKPGTYAYHCGIHPFMKGTLTVN